MSRLTDYTVQYSVVISLLIDDNKIENYKNTLQEIQNLIDNSIKIKPFEHTYHFKYGNTIDISCTFYFNNDSIESAKEKVNHLLKIDNSNHILLLSVLGDYDFIEI